MFVMTWNMQGAQGYADRAGGKNKRKRLEGTNVSDAINMIGPDLDVLCLQEAGSAPDGWGLQARIVNGYQLDVGLVTLGTRRRTRTALVAWYDSTVNLNAGNDRCSMAIISTSHTNAATLGVTFRPATPLRPLLGLQTASGVWIYSLHAPSGNHNAAAGYMRSLINRIPNGRHWVCAGDYNCSPADMVNEGFGGRVVATNDATHIGGNTLDFAIRSPLAIVTLDVNGGALMSDHFSQKFRVA